MDDKFLPEPGRLLPEADPTDLRRLWDIQQEIQELYKKYPPGAPGTAPQFVQVVGLDQSPLPEVDPGDLKTAWAMRNGLQQFGGQVGPDDAIEYFRKACSPGADVQAVLVRLSQIELVRWASGRRLPALEMRDDKSANAVFRTLATSPIIQTRFGDTPTYRYTGTDLEKLTGLLQKELDK